MFREGIYIPGKHSVILFQLVLVFGACFGLRPLLTVLVSQYGGDRLTNSAQERVVSPHQGLSVRGSLVHLMHRLFAKGLSRQAASQQGFEVNGSCY